VNFHAWAVARYVGQVAAAGKAVYPLAALCQCRCAIRSSRGARHLRERRPHRQRDSIWKAEAPAIDVLAPDIYMSNTAAYLKVLDLYHRPDNALFIPETSGAVHEARFLFSALGLQAIGYSPFGWTTRETIRSNPAIRMRRMRFLTPRRRTTAHRPHDARCCPPQLRGQAAGGGRSRRRAHRKRFILETGTRWFPTAQAAGAPPKEIPSPSGAPWSRNSRTTSFWSPDTLAASTFRPAGTEQQRKSGNIVAGVGQTPSAQIDGKWQHRQFLRVEEGVRKRRFQIPCES
jgi:hypothetical protein